MYVHASTRMHTNAHVHERTNNTQVNIDANAEAMRGFKSFHYTVEKHIHADKKKHKKRLDSCDVSQHGADTTEEGTHAGVRKRFSFDCSECRITASELWAQDACTQITALVEMEQGNFFSV